MGKLILFVLLFIGIKSFAQTNISKRYRNEAIRLDSIGQLMHNLKEHQKAFDYFSEAIKADSTFGDAYYHRGISLVYIHPTEFIDTDKCKEFKKAIKYGKAISEEELFFYGCDLKKRLKEERNSQKK